VRDRVPAAAPTEPAPRIEATSLLGRPLRSPPLPVELRQLQESLLERARAVLVERPDDADARIWIGRRLGYLGRYGEAIETFTQGIERHPGDVRFLRHRGHRYITIRRFEQAASDLERAAILVRGRPDEVEPDGLPNARGVPTSTLQSNIWYHLGLARYLQGDFAAALAAYRECLAVATNPDKLCATSHWLYLTLRRLGRESEARSVLEPISAGMELVENHEYHRLLLLYRGEIEVETLAAEAAADPAKSAATAYGVARWLLHNGERARAWTMLERIVAGDAWAAFGAIAAEADLARRDETTGDPTTSRSPRPPA